MTFVVLAPEHPLVDKLTTSSQHDAVKAYVQNASEASEIDRLSTDTEKTLWVAWSDSQFLQSNTAAAYGCIHSNPFFGDLSPGKSSHRRGRLEVLSGSPLEAYQSFLKEFGESN